MITVDENTPTMTPISVADTAGLRELLDVDTVLYRPFDADRGDERKFTAEEAYAAALLRVKDRGCRQQVRQVDRPHDDDHLIPRWLIQDI